MAHRYIASVVVLINTKAEDMELVIPATQPWQIPMIYFADETDFLNETPSWWFNPDQVTAELEVELGAPAIFQVYVEPDL